MKSIRVLALSTSPGHCGIGDYNHTLCASLIAQGHRVDMIELRREGDRTPPIREFAARLPEYDAAIIQHEFSFFGETIAATMNEACSAIRALRTRGKPAVMFMHTDFPGLQRRPVLRPWSAAARARAARRRLLNEINRNAQRLRIFVHQDRSKNTLMGFGVRSDCVEAITFPVRTASSFVEPRPLFDTDQVHLMIFGFIVEHKGYEVALKAMRLLPDNFHLTIAGEASPFNPNGRILDAIYGYLHTGEWDSAEEYPPVRDIPGRFTRAESQSLRKRVTVTGYVPPDKIEEVMSQADIALLPYRRGPSGSAALSAVIGLARPIIASGVDAFRNIAKSTTCFKLVAFDAPFQLAEEIRSLAANLEERRRMASECRAFSAAHGFGALAKKYRHVVGLLGADDPAVPA